MKYSEIKKILNLKTWFLSYKRNNLINKLSPESKHSSWLQVNNDKRFRKDLLVLNHCLEKYNFLLSVDVIKEMYDERERKEDFFKDLLFSILENIKYDFEYNLWSELIPDEPKFFKYLILLNKKEISFEDLPDELKRDEAIILKFAIKDILIIDKLDFEVRDKILNDINFAKELINKKYKAFQYLSDEIKNNPDDLLSLLKKDFRIYPLLDNKFKEDENFKNNAIKSNLICVQYMPEKCNDDHFMREAIELNPVLFNYASENLRFDDDLAKKVIEKYPRAFEYASDRIRDNEEIANNVIKNFITLFDHVSDRLKDKEDFVSNFIGDSHYIYISMSKRLRNNKEMFLYAMEKHVDKRDSICLFAGEELIQDIETLKIIIRHIKEDSSTIDLLPKKMLFLEDVKYEILKRFPQKINIYKKHIEKEIRENYLRSNNMSSIEYKNMLLRANKEMAKNFIDINPLIIKYISANIKDRSFYENYRNLIIKNKDDLIEDYQEAQKYLREEKLLKEINRTTKESVNKRKKI